MGALWGKTQNRIEKTSQKSLRTQVRLGGEGRKKEGSASATSLQKGTKADRGKPFHLSQELGGERVRHNNRGKERSKLGRGGLQGHSGAYTERKRCPRILGERGEKTEGGKGSG